MQQGLLLSQEALQIVEKRRDTEGKGEREIYPIEYRVPKYRRDKKAFFGEQCKERDESNTMGKTRDLFKKTGATK